MGREARAGVPHRSGAQPGRGAGGGGLTGFGGGGERAATRRAAASPQNCPVLPPPWAQAPGLRGGPPAGRCLTAAEAPPPAPPRPGPARRLPAAPRGCCGVPPAVIAAEERGWCRREAGAGALMSRRGLTSALCRAGRMGLNSYKCRFVPLENSAAQTGAAAVRQSRCVREGKYLVLRWSFVVDWRESGK